MIMKGLTGIERRRPRLSKRSCSCPTILDYLIHFMPFHGNDVLFYGRCVLLVQRRVSTQSDRRLRPLLDDRHINYLHLHLSSSSKTGPEVIQR
jgi:hypothetical protein